MIGFPGPYIFANPERINLLRRCWETRRFLEGLHILVRPARAWLYRLGKRTRRKPTVSLERRTADAAPCFGNAVSPVFAGRMNNFETPHDLEALFREVEQQLRGVFRLAGSDYRISGLDVSRRWLDAEHGHAFHRLYWAVRYAQAAGFGHASAAEGFERDWNVWRHESSRDETLAHAAYTVSERIASLAESLYWLPGPAVGALVLQLKEQMWTDACMLSKSIEFHLGVHNHLLNNARALFVASAALHDCSEAASWRHQAFEIWDRYFPRLVLNDGTFSEQSSHYHLLLCRTALEYVLASRLSAHSLPDGFQRQARDMFRLADDLLRADGSLPRFGDNSPDHTVVELWGLLAAAYHYGLLDRIPQHRAITPLTLYYCGTAPKFQSDHSSRSASRFYPDGGFAFLRSAVSGAELVAHVDTRPETHAHGDAGRGSFEVWWQGHAVIREPGCFLRRNDAKSAWYRSGAAQNVTCLEGLAPAVSKGEYDSLPAWYWPQHHAQAIVSRGEIRYRCRSFGRLQSDLVLSRSWNFGENGHLAMEERIDGDRHERRDGIGFESRLHLGTGACGPIRWNAEGNGASLEFANSRQSVMRMTLEIPPGVKASLRDGSVSPEYGIELPAKVLLLRGRPALPLLWKLHCEFLSNPFPHVAPEESSVGHLVGSERVS